MPFCFPINKELKGSHWLLRLSLDVLEAVGHER